MDVLSINFPNPLAFRPESLIIGTIKKPNTNTKISGCPPEGGILVVTGPLSQDTFEISKQYYK